MSVGKYLVNQRRLITGINVTPMFDLYWVDGLPQIC
jgi:hypothetical protein